MHLKNKLIQMVNATYSYRAKEHKITGFEIIDNLVLISTDKGMLKFDEESCEDVFRNEFIQVPNREVPDKPNNSLNDLTIYNQLKAEDITAVLSKTIKGLQEGTIKPKDANAINQTIKTYMDCIKTEIAVKKLKGS